MYSLPSDFFEKDDNYLFKARNSCCVQGIQNKSDDYLYLYIRNLENWFFGTKIYLYLQVENTKWILCCRQKSVICAVFKISDVLTVISYNCMKPIVGKKSAFDGQFLIVESLF